MKRIQVKKLKSAIESSKKRISDLDKLFSRIYEDNILGKLSDDRYTRMASEYEHEQKELIALVENSEKELAKTNQATVDMKMLSQGLREFTDMKELTPTVVNKLIQRIEIHKNEKKPFSRACKSGHLLYRRRSCGYTDRTEVA